jgi:hypothetical protein
MGITYPITWTGGVFNGQGGDNDGVVPLSSQKWGTWMSRNLIVVPPLTGRQKVSPGPST